MLDSERPRKGSMMATEMVLDSERPRKGSTMQIQIDYLDLYR